MLRNLLIGAAAGAAGTAALNIATYLDMAARGRPASQVPAKVATDLTRKAGIPLSNGGDRRDRNDETAKNRSSGLGALLGYATGLSLGALFGALRPRMRGMPFPLAGTGLALAAMALGDAPAITLGETNPRDWTAATWLSDIVPHALYGVVTAAAFDASSAGRSPAQG